MVASERPARSRSRSGSRCSSWTGASLDLALDGADEVDDWLGLIKGGGGALLREKIVISAARRFVVIAEASKKVERLGERFRLPVEVVRFGWKDTRRRLSRLLPDSRAAGRRRSALRDRRGPLHPRRPDPSSIDPAGLADLATGLRAVPGVVEHGLFLDMAELALLGHEDGTVERLERG